MNPDDFRRNIADVRHQRTDEFSRLFYGYAGKRRIDKWDHYLQIYDRLLSPYRNTPLSIRLLEIGVFDGGSLELWRATLVKQP